MSQIFGSPNQNGYVVRDIEAAMEAWLAVGVGPWIYLEDVPIDWFRHRGQDCPLWSDRAAAVRVIE